MKKYIQSIFIIPAVVVALVSCQKNISLDPLTFQTTDKTNEAQLTNQLVGVYSILGTEQLYGQGMWGYFGGGTDEYFRTDAATGTATQVLTESFRSSSADATYLNLWKNLYTGIERANVLLSVVNQPAMNEAKRANIKGQALFLRAYYFYLLVSNFGDVPYKTILTSNMGTNFDLPETPTKDIYDSIINDMSAADFLVQNITQAQTTTVVTQSAVEAMLARVCLTAAGSPNNGGLPYYQKALYWSEQLIKNGQSAGMHSLNSAPHPQYSATPAYARVFINNMQNNFTDKNLNEGIWDAAFLSNGVGSYAGLGYPANQQLGVIMGITSPSAGTRATGIYRSFPTLYNAYGNGDLRRDWVFAPYLLDSNNNRLFNMGVRVTITPGRTVVFRDTTFVNGIPVKLNYDTTFYGSGATAVATVDVNTGSITAINITNAGSGYTTAKPPSITISSPTTGKNFRAGTISIDPTSGAINAIPITNTGTGYVTIYDKPVAKWRREYELNFTKNTTVTSCNFPIIRYADVLLMAAEADLWARGGGIETSPTGTEYYNQVKRRAYGYTPSAASPVDEPVVTLENIKAERSRELCFEGVRRNDLKRWGLSEMINTLNALKTNLGIYNASYPPTGTILTSSTTGINNFLSNPQKFVLFPIPASEFALEGALSQNAGW